MSYADFSGQAECIRLRGRFLMERDGYSVGWWSADVESSVVCYADMEDSVVE